METSSQQKEEKKFSKYETRGSYHWREMRSRDPRVFNAHHQAHYEWILKLAGDLKGKKVLDIGCGDGVLVYLLARAGADATGIDNEEWGLKYARENLTRENRKGDLQFSFVNASAYEMPFPEGAFDVVVCCEVIEHVQEPERLLREAQRVLKRGGKIILTTPYRLTESPMDPHHVREFFPGELKALLETSFTDVGVKPTHHVSWLSAYLYPALKGRPIGKWVINIVSILFKWNPFLRDYPKPGKMDIFSTICAWGFKGQ